MIREFQEFGSHGEVDYAEHSHASQAKKIVSVEPKYASAAGGLTTIAPLQGVVAGASASLSLTKGKSYRIIASTATYFRLSVGASTAVVGDIYLPADTPMLIKADPWDTLSFIQVASGGIIQAVEVS